MVANKATNDLQLSLVFADILPPEAAKVPRFLLNSPFFKAHANRSEGDTKGHKDADGESFRFGYLEIIRLGAGLNTYDFETLAALYQLINITTKASPPEITLLQERLQSKVGHAVSVQANKIDIENNTYAGIKKVNTTFGVTTPTAVCRYLGRKTDAESLSICRESIYRLNGNTFTLINHKNNRSERRVPLFSLSLNQSEAMIISFSPQLSALYHGLLEFNLAIYKQLTPVGQVMMLWMNDQKGKQSIELKDAKDRSNYTQELKAFKRDLTKGEPKKNKAAILPKMVELGFIKEFEITGTGRSTPFVLHYKR